MLHRWILIFALGVAATISHGLLASDSGLPVPGEAEVSPQGEPQAEAQSMPQFLSEQAAWAWGFASRQMRGAQSYLSHPRDAFRDGYLAVVTAGVAAYGLARLHGEPVLQRAFVCLTPIVNRCSEVPARVTGAFRRCVKSGPLEKSE